MAKVHELAEHDMVVVESDGFGLKPTELGIIACKHYCSFESMKIMSKITALSTENELIQCLSMCAEFADIVRVPPDLSVSLQIVI